MSTMLAKPVRVIHELTAAERTIRAVKRAMENHAAAVSRADSALVDAMKEAIGPETGDAPVQG